MVKRSNADRDACEAQGKTLGGRVGLGGDGAQSVGWRGFQSAANRAFFACERIKKNNTRVCLDLKQSQKYKNYRVRTMDREGAALLMVSHT